MKPIVEGINLSVIVMQHNANADSFRLRTPLYTYVAYGIYEHYDQKIDLPFLKTLIVKEVTSDANSSGAYSILEAITAPLLEIFENHIEFWDLSLKLPQTITAYLEIFCTRLRQK